MREGLLQYFQSEAKVQQNHTSSPNYVSRDAFSKVHGQAPDRGIEEIYQHSNGLTTNEQSLFNLPNGNGDSCTFHPHKLPPGLPVPNVGNTYLLQMQQNKYEMSADKDRSSQPMINFPDLSDTFRPQREMKTPFFGLFSEDLYTQSSTRFSTNEQHVPQDINQLVNRLQSFMNGERDSFCPGDFPTMHKQTLGTQQEDSVAEQWKFTSPPLSAQSTIQTPKQTIGEFGIVQMERNGGVRKPTFNYNAFQDLPGCSPQNIENIHQPQPFSASLNQPNQYHNKMAAHTGLNQYSKHHFQQSQIQKQNNPHLKKDNTAAFLGDGVSARPKINNHVREGDKKRVLSHNPYLDFQGSMQRYDGENSIFCAGNTQQFMPLMYPTNDQRRNSGIPVGSIRALSNGSRVAGLDARDAAANESAAFNCYVSDLMTHRGESAHHGMAPAASTPAVVTQRAPVVQLYFYLDECYEQWKSLEKERKRVRLSKLRSV